jgi:hypothetical protein
MSVTDKLPSFAAGVAAAGIAFTIFVPVSAQVKKEVIVACADAEGTMRLHASPGPCRPGERRIVLKTPELEDPKKDEPKDDKKVADLDQRLKDLEERNARGRLLGSRVTAPFEVVNEAGKRVFYVEEGYVRAYNASGAMVARIVANEHGGFFEGRSATSGVVAAIGSSDQQVGVVLNENDKRRLRLGVNDKGSYGLRIYNTSDKMVAGIGQSQAGPGIAMVADAEGNLKARMYTLPSGAGIVEAVNGQGIGVATMSAAGADGAGLLQLTTAAGTVMVEAGVLKGAGIGVVRAGPAGFNSGVGFVGLPGSFIQGKASN